MTAPSLQVFSLSNVGRVRDHNEDTTTVFTPNDEVQASTKGALAIVADGMGGFDAGEVASAEAVKAFAHAYYANPEPDPRRAMYAAAQRADAVVRALPARCGTTLVAAAAIGPDVTVLNVGDSRAYFIGKETERQISADHSWVAEQVTAGNLTAKQAEHHPRKNVLTRAVGTGECSDADLYQEHLEIGDTIVLCSDGLHGLVSLREVAHAVRGNKLDAAGQHLIDLANKRGGHDNISVAMIRLVPSPGSLTIMDVIGDGEKIQPAKAIAVAALCLSLLAGGFYTAVKIADPDHDRPGSTSKSSGAKNDSDKAKESTKSVDAVSAIPVTARIREISAASGPLSMACDSPSTRIIIFANRGAFSIDISRITSGTTTLTAKQLADRSGLLKEPVTDAALSGSEVVILEKSGSLRRMRVSGNSIRPTDRSMPSTTPCVGVAAGDDGLFAVSNQGKVLGLDAPASADRQAGAADLAVDPNNDALRFLVQPKPESNGDARLIEPKKGAITIASAGPSNRLVVGDGWYASYYDGKGAMLTNRFGGGHERTLIDSEPPPSIKVKSAVAADGGSTLWVLYMDSDDALWLKRFDMSASGAK